MTTLTQPSGKPVKVLPWSYSSLQSFETCPRRHMLTRLTKQVTEAHSPQMAEGNAVHKALEKAVLATEPLPAKYKRFIPIVQRVRAAPGQKLAEQDVAITVNFKPTGYWDQDAWFRGKIDLTILRPKTAFAFDWKTGKVKTDGDQLALFAAATFAQHPRVETVHTAYAWLEFNKLDSKTYVRADVPGIWQEFLPRVKRLVHALDTGDFPPKPSGLCREWCPVPRGLCEFSGKA